MQLRKTDLTWHTVGEEIVVLDLDGSVYLKLNGSGRMLWELLTDPSDEESLAAALVGGYGIDKERAAADVGAFLADLRQRGLLVE